MSVPKNVLNRLVKLPQELIIIDFIPHVRHDEIVVEIPRPDTVPVVRCFLVFSLETLVFHQHSAKLFSLSWCCL